MAEVSKTVEQLEAEVARYRWQLEAVTALMAQVTGHRDLESFVAAMLDLALGWVPADVGAVVLMDHENQRTVPLVSRGLSRDTELAMPSLPYCYAGDPCFPSMERKIVQTEHHPNCGLSGELIRREKLEKLACCALSNRERVIGLLLIGAREAGLISEEDLTLLDAIAKLMGIAIEHVNLDEARLQAERQAVIGQTVAGIAHGIRNYLTLLGGGSRSLDRALELQSIPMAAEAWAATKEGIERITELTWDMLEYSKKREPVRKPVSADGLLRSLAAIVADSAKANGTTLEVEVAESLPTLQIDEGQIHHALLNLLRNAIQAMPEGGTARLFARSKTVPRSKGGADAQALVEIGVADTGPGIPPDARDRIFEPFVSSRGSRGTGLGLPVTKKIVEEHGGTITFESKAGEGTTFLVRLPAELRPFSGTSESRKAVDSYDE